MAADQGQSRALSLCARAILALGVLLMIVQALLVFTPWLSYHETYLDAHTGRLKMQKLVAGTGWVISQRIEDTAFSRLSQHMTDSEAPDWRLVSWYSTSPFGAHVVGDGEYGSVRIPLKDVALWASLWDWPAGQASDYVKLALTLLQEGRLDELKDLSQGPGESDVWEAHQAAP